jgi:DNA-binding MarR family transcriptional regulator
MHHQRSEIDRRSVRVKLTEKGRHVRTALTDLFARHSDILARRSVMDDALLHTINGSLKRMERFWTEQIRYIY